MKALKHTGFFSILTLAIVGGVLLVAHPVHAADITVSGSIVDDQGKTFSRMGTCTFNVSSYENATPVTSFTSNADQTYSFTISGGSIYYFSVKSCANKSGQALDLISSKIKIDPDPFYVPTTGSLSRDIVMDVQELRGVIAGKFVYDDGIAPQGIFILFDPVTDSSFEWLYHATTNNAGNFRVSLPAGTYKLTYGGDKILPTNLVVPSDSLTTMPTITIKNRGTLIFGFFKDTNDSPLVLSRGWYVAHSANGEYWRGGTLGENLGASVPTANDTWYLTAVAYYQGAVWRARAIVITNANNNIYRTDMVFEKLRDLTTLPAEATQNFMSGDGTTLTLTDGTKVVVPVGALPYTTSRAMILTASPVVDIGSYNIGYPVGGLMYNMTMTTATGHAVEQFTSDVAITIPYTEVQLTSAGITESQIVPAYLKGNRWVQIKRYTVDTVNNTVTAYANHFSSFALTVDISNATPGSTVVPGLFGDQVIGAGPGTKPTVKVLKNGTLVRSFDAYESSFRGGVNVAIGDLNASYTGRFVVAPGNGHTPEIKVYTRSARRESSFMAFPVSYTGGVSVAVGNFSRYGGSDSIITAPMGNYQGEVRMYDRKGKKQGRTLIPFGTDFKGGLNIAAGDVNGDGNDELIVAPRSGAKKVTVYTYSNARFKVLKSFSPYGTSYRSGISVASGDVNNDSYDDIIVGPQSGSQEVKIYKWSSSGFNRFGSTYYAFGQSFKGGVNLASADTNNDGSADVLVAPAGKRAPDVRIYSGTSTTLLKEIRAFAASFKGGLSVAAHTTLK